MTRQESIKLFRDMWRSMSDVITDLEQTISILDYKYEYLKERGIICEHDCPLCEFVTEVAGLFNHSSECCKFCPIEWKSVARSYMCEYSVDTFSRDITPGLWWKAHIATDWKEQAELCLKISQLPEKY